jgi:REP element-mobilizing transposase RayT
LSTYVTAPRQVLENVTYLVTRRCAQRQFLLRPSPLTSAIFLYVLALAAQRYGIQVHAFCVLSNHFHLVLTDPHARLPAFHQLLDALVARAVNSTLGRWESFWAPSSYSAVALTSKEDVVAKTAYVLANPVAAGLVGRAAEWPGLWSAPEQLGVASLTARRPAKFFRANGYLPESAELALAVPPGFSSAEEFRARVSAALQELEAAARHERRQSGRGFLGPRRVLAQKPWSRALAWEPRRALNPRIAARDKWKRIEALGRLVEFLDAYRRAREALRRGVRDALFPPGTYLLRVAYGVRCAGSG